MPSFVKVYVGCVLISQSGYPSIPPGFVSWPRSYSQSLFPSLSVSIQDFPAFCPARRMKPGIRPQGSFSLNGQEWRRTPRCKPYFSRLCRRISTLLQVIFFFTHHQCITSHSSSSCHSTDILHSECAKYMSRDILVPQEHWFFCASVSIFLLVRTRNISNYAKWIVMLSSGGTLTSWNVLNASHLSPPASNPFLFHTWKTHVSHMGVRGDND